MQAKNTELNEYILHWRRYFHQKPELSYEEYGTQKALLKELARFPNLQVKKLARTGIVADLNPNANGPLIAIRADMDALPMAEETDLPFRSEHPGVMHACGHDAHMAILLGTIRYLHDEKDAGRFRFIFQPSEENNFNDEEGWSGAQRMVSEGAIDGVDVTIGLHQRPDLPSGTLGLQPGTVMASADMFEMIVHGKSAHAGAAPEKGIDSIVIASDWVQGLQTIISRRISPRSTGVISVGTIEGGQIANIVADRVRMTGTIRSRDPETRATILREVETLNRSLEQRYSAKLRWEVIQEVPLTFNSPEISATISRAVQEGLPQVPVLTDVDMMAAEDFSYYGMQRPSFFGFLGTGLPDGPAPYGLHHPKMSLDENAMLVGVQFFVTAARALQKNLSSSN